MSLFLAFHTRESTRMRLQREKQVKPISEQQQARDAEIQELLLANRSLGRKVPAERARYRQADRGQKHHGAVGARRRRIESLVVITDTSRHEGNAERKQQIRE